MSSNGKVASSAFQLRCLGPALLSAPGAGPLSLRTRKQLGLLVYLARRGRAVPRDELIDLLWSEDPEKLARHSLSQGCSLINKVLGGEVLGASGRDRLALAEGAVWLDANEFERLAGDGRHADAMALWRGVFFEGLWVQRAPNFERWVAGERDKLHRMYRRLAHVRIESLRQSGDHGAMRDEADRLLQQDPLDEKAMLAHLEALTLLGDRSLALRRYAEFEKLLHTELEAEPGAPLRGWARRARKSDAGTMPAADRLPAPRISEITVLPAVQPFFGRTEEFGMLWKAWETAGTGKGSFIIIEGEAGIGKTALATKLVNQAHVAGGSVCFVKCYRTEKSVPFAPITTLVRQLCRLPGFVATDPVWIGELSRLAPDLRDRYPAVPQPMAMDEAARHRLSDAVVSAAMAVADEQPLMVVLDDIAEADEASLALIHYLGRQTPIRPFLLLGTVRSEMPLSGFERTFFETAQGAGFMQRAAISPLPERDIGRLVEQVLARRGVSSTAWQVRRIAASCRGNPLAAVEASVAMASTSVQVPEAEEEMSATEETSERLLDSATPRLVALRKEARAVANALAIAGRPLSEYEIGMVSGLPPAELAAAINALDDAHFTRRLGANVAFTHELYIGAVENELGKDEGRDLHHRLAMLARRATSSNPAMHYEAARHFLSAGIENEARSEAIAAASYASSVGAIRNKADALEVIDKLPGGLSSDGLYDLCFCYLHLNDLGALRNLCGRAHYTNQVSRLQLSFFEIAADFQSGDNSFEETTVRLAADLEGASEDEPTWKEACVLLLRVADKTGRVKLVRDYARRLRRHSPSSHAMFAAAYVHLKYYKAALALTLMERALVQARSEHQVETEQLARDGIAILLKQVGRYRDSIDQFDYSLGLARKSMNPHAEVVCLHNRAVSEMCLGDWDRMHASHAEAERVGAGFARWGFHLYRAYNDSIVAYYDAQHEFALNSFESVFAGCMTHGLIALARDAKAAVGLTCQRLGDVSGLRRAVTELEKLGPGQNYLGWVDHAAVAFDQAINRGQPQQALDLLSRSSRALGKRDVSYQIALDWERIRLQEWISGNRALQERNELSRRALQLEATYITRELQR